MSAPSRGNVESSQRTCGSGRSNAAAAPRTLERRRAPPRALERRPGPTGQIARGRIARRPAPRGGSRCGLTAAPTRLVRAAVPSTRRRSRSDRRAASDDPALDPRGRGGARADDSESRNGRRLESAGVEGVFFTRRRDSQNQTRLSRAAPAEACLQDWPSPAPVAARRRGGQTWFSGGLAASRRGRLGSSARCGLRATDAPRPSASRERALSCAEDAPVNGVLPVCSRSSRPRAGRPRVQ